MLSKCMPMAYNSLRLRWVVPGWQGSPHPGTHSLPTGKELEGQKREKISGSSLIIEEWKRKKRCKGDRSPPPTSRSMPSRSPSNGYFGHIPHPNFPHVLCQERCHMVWYIIKKSIGHKMQMGCLRPCNLWMPEPGLLTPFQCPAPVNRTPDVPSAVRKVQKLDSLFLLSCPQDWIKCWGRGCRSSFLL